MRRVVKTWAERKWKKRRLNKTRRVSLAERVDREDYLLQCSALIDASSILPSLQKSHWILSSPVIQYKTETVSTEYIMTLKYDNTSVNLGPIFSRPCRNAKERVSRCFYFSFSPSASLTQQSKTPNLSCFTIWNSIIQNLILHVKLSKHCRVCIRTTWNTNGCDACSGVQSPRFLILYIKILCTLNKA